MTKEEDTDYGILMPKELAEEALNSHNCIGAAYTYNVPVFPQWKMKEKEKTQVETIYELKEAAGKYLNYVYTGNC